MKVELLSLAVAALFGAQALACATINQDCDPDQHEFACACSGNDLVCSYPHQETFKLLTLLQLGCTFDEGSNHYVWGLHKQCSSGCFNRACK